MTLKILFVTGWYPSRAHTVQGVFVREHAKAVSLNDDVMVLHLAGPAADVPRFFSIEEESDPALTEGIPTIRVWHRAARIRLVARALFVLSIFPGYRFLRARRVRPNVIHAHVSYVSGPGSAILGVLFRAPLVITEHSSEFPRRRLSRMNVRAARIALGRAKVLMPVSHALGQAIENYGLHHDDVRIVPNAVDVSLFRPPESSPEVLVPRRLLFVGLFVEVKGFPQLLRALASMKRNDWRLDVVGDGPERESYARLRDVLELGDKVEFHGLRTKSEIAERMRSAHLLVLPSLWESLPCVAIEAMATGLPVVASRVGGIPEVVEEPSSGILVPAGDEGALARAIATHLDSGEVNRTHIAERARERFSLQAVGRRLAGIYEEIA